MHSCLCPLYSSPVPVSSPLDDRRQLMKGMCARREPVGTNKVHTAMNENALLAKTTPSVRNGRNMSNRTSHSPRWHGSGARTSCSRRLASKEPMLFYYLDPVHGFFSRNVICSISQTSELSDATPLGIVYASRWGWDTSSTAQYRSLLTGHILEEKNLPG